MSACFSSILPVKTQVHFLPPIYPEQYHGLNSFQISDMVKKSIADKLVELGCAKE